MNLRFRKSGVNRSLRWGLALLGALAFCAAFADFLAPYSPAEQHRDYPFAPPAGQNRDRGSDYPFRLFVSGYEYRLFGLIPCRLHLFGADDPARLFILGTDALGRDIFSRLLYGARLSLTIAAVALLISFPLGLFIGTLAGYYGGAADFIGMRLIELFLALPALYLIIALRGALPLDLEPERVFLAMVAVIALLGWAHLARVVRGMTLSLRERDFVRAAVALGASDWRVMRKHILPQLTGFTLTQAALAAPGYILAEVTLSYLGLGVQEPVPSWGNMLSAAQSVQVMSDHWWNLAPAVAIFITSLTFHLLAEGLKKRFDPHLQEREMTPQLLS